MKRLMWLMFFCLIYSTTLLAGGNEGQNNHRELPPITGTYIGNVLNGDDMDPVLTTFYLNDSGNIVGKYAMGEEAGLELGSLSDFRTEGSYTIVVNWKDKYGSGVLRMLFSSDYSLFYGLWGASESDTSLPWNGLK